MNPLPTTPELLDLARRMIWFEEPKRALRDPVRFLTYTTTYAIHSDTQIVRQHVGDDDLREFLRRRPESLVAAPEPTGT